MPCHCRKVRSSPWVERQDLARLKVQRPRAAVVAQAGIDGREVGDLGRGVGVQEQRVLLHGQQLIQQRDQVLHGRQHGYAGLGGVAAGGLIAVGVDVGNRPVAVPAATDQVTVHQVGEVLVVPVLHDAGRRAGTHKGRPYRTGVGLGVAAGWNQAPTAPVDNQPVAPLHQVTRPLGDFQAGFQPVLALQRIEGRHVHVPPGQREAGGLLEPLAAKQKVFSGFLAVCGPSRITRPAVRGVEQLQHARAVRHHRVDQHAKHVASRLAVHAPQSGIGPARPPVGACTGRLRRFGRRYVHQRTISRQAPNHPLQLLARQRRAHLARAAAVGRRDVHRRFHVTQPPQTLDTCVALAEFREQLFLKLAQIRLARRRTLRF